MVVHKPTYTLLRRVGPLHGLLGHCMELKIKSKERFSRKGNGDQITTLLNRN